MAPLARLLVAVAHALPRLLHAYPTGGGVAWGTFGADAIEAQGNFNRPWILRQLTSEFLPAVPDVHQRLVQGARVAEFACGVGWASIAIAKAYPKATVHGFDVDGPSIGLARQFAADHGVAGRVRFERRDVAGGPLAGRYDFVLMIEALHDLARPVEALQTIRQALKPGGVAIVADERTAETFTVPGDEVERVFYGFSILCCLPAGMAEQPSAGTGTVMRPATMQRYAQQAGFASATEITAIDHPFLRFYRLQP